MAIVTGTLTGTFTAKCRETREATVAGGPAVHHDHAFEVLLSMLNGTSNGQQDVVWSDRRSISGASNMDLAGGVTAVTNPSSTLTFAEVTLIAIRNLSTTSGEYLTIGEGSNPFNTWVSATGDSVIVHPGGFLVLGNPTFGYTVTAATGDILRVTPATGTISFDIFIAGRSA